MEKRISKVIACLMIVVMVLSIAPIGGLAGVDLFSTVASAAAKDWAGYDCVAYAKARFKEYWGFDLHATGSDGANGYYHNAASFGDTVSSTPKVGALAVWDSDYNIYGHVAFVEQVNGNQVTISEGGFDGHYRENTTSSSTMSRTWYENGVRRHQAFLGYVYVKGTTPGSLIDFWDISNPDNSPAWIDTSGTPTISGARKFWFKETDPDTNYYIDIFVDGVKVIANGSSDAHGYIWYVVETGELSNGLHTITADLYDSRAKYTASKSFYVNNLICFHSISDPDNTGWLEDPSKTPTISGVKRIWFREVDPDTNYYIDLYIDDKKVVSNGSSDPNGFFSFVVDTSTLYNCEHTVRAELFDSTTYYSAVKHFIAYNDKCVVTFDANGGKVDITQKTFVCGKNYGTLPTPIRTGFKFDGWYTSKNGGTKITESTKVTSKNNHTLYARWICDHSYNLSTITQPTCTAAGTKTYTCTICGTTKTEVIPAKGHTEETIKGYLATCTGDGITDGVKCSVCGEILTVQEIIPAKGHVDADKDGYCDECAAELEHYIQSCDCICHKTGFTGLIYKIIRVFWKLFKINKTCACGGVHY